MSNFTKALKQLNQLPRINLKNSLFFPGSKRNPFHGLNRKKRGFAHRGFSQFQTWLPIGHLERKTPFHIAVPFEPYNIDHLVRQPLVRVSLLDLQRMIDMNRVDVNDLIDLTTFANTHLVYLNPLNLRHHGIHLTEEGIDQFSSKINIEVQFASEGVIAAIERTGGCITTRYYDPYSVHVKIDPEKFFKKGLPIPRCQFPPQNAVDYYSSPENRGYLAAKKDIDEARYVLSQKFGYHHTPLSDAIFHHQRKHSRQLFFGLEPGWVVNIPDQVVLKPIEEEYKNFYGAE